MQRITKIVGCRQEGKTKELIEEYKSGLKITEKFNNYKCVFIKCFKGNEELPPEVMKLMNDGIVHGVENIKSLIHVVENIMLEGYDAHFFIDDASNISNEFGDFITAFANRYPMSLSDKKATGSFDVTYTELKQYPIEVEVMVNDNETTAINESRVERFKDLLNNNPRGYLSHFALVHDEAISAIHLDIAFNKRNGERLRIGLQDKEVLYTLDNNITTYKIPHQEDADFADKLDKLMSRLLDFFGQGRDIFTTIQEEVQFNKIKYTKRT